MLLIFYQNIVSIAQRCCPIFLFHYFVTEQIYFFTRQNAENKRTFDLLMSPKFFTFYTFVNKIFKNAPRNRRGLISANFELESFSKVNISDFEECWRSGFLRQRCS